MVSLRSVFIINDYFRAYGNPEIRKVKKPSPEGPALVNPGGVCFKPNGIVEWHMFTAQPIFSDLAQLPARREDQVFNVRIK
jgi:hypothetical protein